MKRRKKDGRNGNSASKRVGEQMELRITLTRLMVIRQLSRNLIYWALTFELRLREVKVEVNCLGRLCWGAVAGGVQGWDPSTSAAFPASQEERGCVQVYLKQKETLSALTLAQQCIIALLSRRKNTWIFGCQNILVFVHLETGGV